MPVTSAPVESTFIPSQPAVRRGFEQAAATYDSAALLQREAADRMFERLDYIKLAPRRILDAGCGTGYAARKLASRYPRADVIALDVAQNMLRELASQSPWWRRLPLARSPMHLVCGDLQRLPLAAAGIDLLWSNLALPWCDLGRAVTEAQRVLATDGLFMFTSLGPDTLRELRAACQGLDNHPHVHEFVDMHNVGDALVHAGFADPVMDMEVITFTFTDVAGIVADLKALGVRNRLPQRRRGLLTPRLWAQVTDRYERLRQDGKLPVTVELVYGHAWKPQPKKLDDGRAIVRFQPPRRG